MQLIHNRKELVAGIGLLVSVLGLNAWVGIQQVKSLHRNSAWVNDTHEALEALERLAGTVNAAEASQRGYVITGDEEYLAPYEQARREFPSILIDLEQKVGQNEPQRARASELRRRITERFQEMQAKLEVRKSQGPEAARDAIVSGKGRLQMRDILALVSELQRNESALLLVRESENDQAYQSVLLSTLLSVLLALSAVLSFLWLLRRYIRGMERSTDMIHQQRELLHAMLISIGDAVIATDAEGHVTLLNRIAERLTGWSQEEARGEPLDRVFRIINEETREGGGNPALLALRQGQIVGLANHTILISRDGTEWPIDDSAAPVRNDRNEISGAILVFREISERRRHESELKRQTLALQEEDRRKDEFLATLAHELRNPLSPLSNALQIWPLVENDRPQMEQLRQMMERQVSQMTRLIDDLLDVSRITRGKIDLRRQQVDLATLIRGAVEAVQPALNNSSHELSLDLPEAPILVDGDVARLSQVLGNILNNAAKYTGRNGRIHVEARRRGDSAVISVSDNGPGIPANMLSRIFEMFQQVDQTLERSHGGLGIGLTLVKRLVELHNGRVEAHSDGPGQGSTFTITLPCLPTGVELPAAPAPAIHPGRFNHIPRLRVLVVDDVEASAKTLAMMLKAIGQHVDVVHDGPAAVDWVERQQPDLVFLDIAMPGMSGYDVARQIRSRGNSSGTYLVALTGYGQDEDRRRAVEAGFNYHMTKPASLDSLEQLLMTRPASRQSPGAPPEYQTV